MRRRSESWYRSKNAKERRENIIRRSRKGVEARARKRLANPVEREPKMVPFYPLSLGIRDDLSGATGWVKLRSGRQAAQIIANILRDYQPGKTRVL